MLTTTFESIDGRRLRVARMGNGPPIFLLHGYPENLQIWCELAPRLAQHFEIFAFDWPGMGQSDNWPGGTTPIHMAERILKLADFWKCDRISIASMDMGTQPALVFAANYPDRVRSLIAMNSLVIWDAQTSWEIALLRKFGWNRLILRSLPSIVFRRAENTFLPRHTKLPTDLRSDFWQSFKQPEVREFIIRLCAGYQGTLESLPDFYSKIACPTLILWGDLERHFPLVHARTLHSAIPGSKLEIIADGEHWMAWHHAEELWKRIRAFCGTASQ